MQVFKDKNYELLVIKKGEKLVEKLNEYVKNNLISGGWISVIGGASSVTMGYYHPDTKEYEWRSFDEPLEIINIEGNLAYIDGEPFWHIHGTFSRNDCSLIGGHIKECTIGLTGEVALITNNNRLNRYYDEDTGLKLIS